MEPHTHQVLIQEGFDSASDALNDGLFRARNEIVVFVHEDVFLPPSWLKDFNDAIDYLDATDQHWGVLGCIGRSQSGEWIGHCYTPGQGVIGRKPIHPEPIQTLDELLLVVRRSSGLSFDPTLPGFHLYGTDLCLRAARMGLTAYAIAAFSLHNARQYFALPPDFTECYWDVKRRWHDLEPIYASCMKISRFNLDFYRNLLRSKLTAVLRPRRAYQLRGERADDPWEILGRLERERRYN